MLLALAIFAATLTLVIWQPRGLPIGWSALAGAGVALVTGVVRLADIPVVWGLVWNATGTFVAIVLISLFLDEAGTFTWAALHVATWGRGDGRRLFVLIAVLGAAVAAAFANDGAALILTPIVFQMVRALHLPASAAVAFVMATGFIADTTSLPLVVSNLVNIVSADFFNVTFARYALVMVPVALVSLVASIAALLLHFRHAIPARYEPDGLGPAREAIKDPLTFRVGWVVLGVVLVGYFVADPLGVPLSAVAGAAALVMVAVASRRPTAVFSRLSQSTVSRQSAPASDVPLRSADGTTLALEEVAPQTGIAVGRVVRSAPWQVVLFSLGMYLVVYGLRNQGLTDALGHAFAWLTDHGPLATATGTGFLVAGMSSVMNNMPTVLVGALGIDAANVSGLPHEVMVYANIVGADLGPKITPIGSLATLLWLHVLDRRGMHIGWGQYFRTGIVLTLPVLAVVLLALVAWLAVLS